MPIGLPELILIILPSVIISLIVYYSYPKKQNIKKIATLAFFLTLIIIFLIIYIVNLILTATNIST